jgi:hypothetical protein
MFAIGLRNPYRMTYDPVDRLVWIGDVGQEDHEEVDVLRPGANFQWDIMEGLAVMSRPSDPMRERPGVWTDPVLAYDRADFRAMIGGYVYRGAQLASLYGRYVHADFRSGNIWAASYEIADGEVQVLDSEIILESDLKAAESGITSFAVDRDGSLHVLTLGAESRILRLEEALRHAVGPTRLSQTGLFADLGQLEPAQGLAPYSITTPLWSDGSVKRRFVAMAPGERARHSRDAPFELPVGTLLVKHFEIALDERKPEEVHRLETRVLVVDAQGVYGASYRWRADQSDADLLLEHAEEELEIIDRQGHRRSQVHIFPSPGECLRCHQGDFPGALGLKTAQLNGPDPSTSELLALAASDRLDGLPAEVTDGGSRDDLPRFSALDDESASLEHRVRSYLDANCSHCHGMRQMHGTRWDARFQTPLEDAHIVDGEVNGFEGSEELRIVTPGSPERSAIYLRAASADRNHRMPPLGSARPDAAFLDVLSAWIRSLQKPQPADSAADR